jgi:hypothetical protein
MEGINAYVNKYKVVEMRKVAAEPHWISGWIQIKWLLNRCSSNTRLRTKLNQFKMLWNNPLQMREWFEIIY